MVLKGNRDGVAVIIDEAASIDAAVRELRSKLANAGSFFRGAVFCLDAGNRALSPDERSVLSSTMEEFGILLREPKQESKALRGPQEHLSGGTSKSAASDGEFGTLAAVTQDFGSDETLLVRRTLRSGQRIEHTGNVVILGDVNPGAVVMCSGDIIVLGTLRGLAHAGAEGNSQAIVMAFRLQPTQLRIAHFISRAPDEGGPRPDGPELARVRNETIQIEAYEP